MYVLLRVLFLYPSLHFLLILIQYCWPSTIVTSCIINYCNHQYSFWKVFNEMVSFSYVWYIMHAIWAGTSLICSNAGESTVHPPPPPTWWLPP